MWILFAFGSAFFAGITAILAKCGIRKTDSTVATAVRTIVVLLFSWLMVFVVGSQNQLGSIDPNTWLFLILSGNGPKSLKDFGRATVLFLILCGMAFCINLALFRASNGEINMFFVGPANTTLIVFKDIAARFGWYAATALYIPCVSFGAWLIFSAVRLLSKRLRTYAA